MRRITVTPRPEWKALIERQGCTWHSLDNICSWNESAGYVLTQGEVTGLRHTAEEVHALYLQATEHVVRQSLWNRCGIDPAHVGILRASYERGE